MLLVAPVTYRLLRKMLVRAAREAEDENCSFGGEDIVLGRSARS